MQLRFKRDRRLPARPVMAGSEFILEASFVAASVVLGAVGHVPCESPYFVFTRLRAARTALIAPDLEYDVVYDAAEQAARLVTQIRMSRSFFSSQAGPTPQS